MLWSEHLWPWLFQEIAYVFTGPYKGGQTKQIHQSKTAHALVCTPVALACLFQEIADNQ